MQANSNCITCVGNYPMYWIIHGNVHMLEQVLRIDDMQLMNIVGQVGICPKTTTTKGGDNSNKKIASRMCWRCKISSSCCSKACSNKLQVLSSIMSG